MGQTPSDRLDTVADVAAAMEAAGNEITDLRVTVDDDSGRGTAHVSLPIIDERVEASCELDLVTATLDERTLQIELDIAAGTPETTSDETAPPEAPAPETTDGGGAVRTGGADRSTPVDENPSAKRDSTHSVDADSSVESADGEDPPAEHDSTDPGVTDGSAESTTSEAAADSDATASDDPPAYRDPDQLAAVYDSEATFPEMTDALGVDVTPQTVRKYMVEYGIHEPTSRTSDTLAETDRDSKEVTSAETQSERDPETTEPAASESHPISSDTTPADEQHSQRSGGDVQADDTGDTTANDAPDRADTTAESVTSDTSGAAADATPSDDTATTDTQATAQTSGDEPDDATADPPNESTADNPTTTSTATDGGTQPTLSAVESLDLPDEVSVAELVSVLTDSRTVYEVRRGLNVDDGQARTVLRKYDLIDLVTGRITQGAEPPDRQEVLSRLIEASDNAA